MKKRLLSKKYESTLSDKELVKVHLQAEYLLNFAQENIRPKIIPTLRLVVK